MKRGNKPKFHRERNQRKALERSLATALIEKERITTTRVRAKTAARDTEKLITLAKRQTVAARRLARTRVGTRAVEKLFNELALRFKDRAGGYTRVIHLGQRNSDGANMAILEFVS